MTSDTKDAIKDTQYFKRSDGVSLAYHYTPASGSNTPCVVFLSGFKSDMTGSKAVALEQCCLLQGRAFLRFDYQGHGVSSGEFEDGCIGTWAADAFSMLDHITQAHGEKSYILVGSSMGGWIMLLTALQRKNQITAMIGIAAAPDFTERLMLGQLSTEQLAEMDKNGRVVLPSDYDGEPFVITKKLIEDGCNQLLLNDIIDLDIPVRLIHGMQDMDVPWMTAIDIQNRLSSTDVEIQFVKNAGHRLSEPNDLERLFRTLDELINYAR
ncbi:MAG: alpha/beta hydrolase [Rhodospirillales bacterium]|nr:alpha/beta hydrolase [Rhodospirillales bacterium]